MQFKPTEVEGRTAPRHRSPTWNLSQPAVISFQSSQPRSHHTKTSHPTLSSKTHPSTRSLFWLINLCSSSVQYFRTRRTHPEAAPFGMRVCQGSQGAEPRSNLFVGNSHRAGEEVNSPVVLPLVSLGMVLLVGGVLGLAPFEVLPIERQVRRLLRV